MKLLHGFRPATLLPKDLKFPMLLIEYRLLCIEHEAIDRTHNKTSINNGALEARYQTISDRRKPTFGEEPVREVLR